MCSSDLEGERSNFSGVPKAVGRQQPHVVVPTSRHRGWIGVQRGLALGAHRGGLVRSVLGQDVYLRFWRGTVKPLHCGSCEQVQKAIGFSFSKPMPPWPLICTSSCNAQHSPHNPVRAQRVAKAQGKQKIKTILKN